MVFANDNRPLDALLGDAARSAPDRPAIVTADRTVTFAELDATATAVAAGLAAGTEPGDVVALVSTLDPEFAAAYYGIARARCVIAIVNPLLRGPALRHVLTLSGAKVLISSPEIAERLDQEGTPDHVRRRIVLGTEAFQELLGEGPQAAGRSAYQPDDVACIQFTSGTTGPAKAVQLTHRNLVVNAAQIAEAHGLDGDSRMLNHLPNFHPMHLNAGVAAAAGQVLCAAPDSAAALAMANEQGASHYYSLPVRLIRLAEDPRLPGLKLTTVRGIMSGGTGLPTAAAAALSAHFGIPVAQGYGLAETSPLTHSDTLSGPVHGSVGKVVGGGTECRIVGVDSREPLAAGEKGEVLVRGPQLMKGYLGLPSPLDEEGWFATGDLGYQDEEGRLFLVDRLKDVFKHDNWLVSPAEIERVLARHAAVREGVVYDFPHAESGSVAHALVVRAEGADASAEEIRSFVNSQVPYYEHIERLVFVDAVPRSHNGKISRRELREAELRG
ncbi:class I adenylate-forming enzyme family protein [Streptomyces sp. NPDC052396]|uniref:class I adenylate-forming enzyme family protein n=1 Tax=Streptomyces sp. NPDC052396 TaxID=3365689 RepID=UPI0037CF0BFC